MHRPQSGVIHLGSRRRNSFELQWMNRAGGRWRQVSNVSYSDQRERYFAFCFEVEQTVHFRIQKTADYLRREAQGCAQGQQIGENGAVVPPKMPVGSRLILPSIAPISSGADYGNGGMRDRRLSATRVSQNLAIVPRAQFSKPEVAHPKVVDASLQIRKVATDEV